MLGVAGRGGGSEVIRLVCALVPDEALKDLFILGNSEECAEKVHEFVKAGVKHFVMEVVAEDYGGMVRDFGQKVLSGFR